MSSSLQQLAAACSSVEAFMDNNGPAVHPVLEGFASSAVPPITLSDYAMNIAKQCSHREMGPALGLVLLLRIWSIHDAAPSILTVHRLLLACTQLAMKAHYDDFYCNAAMAAMGGIAAAEMVVLELRTLELLDGRVIVSKHSLNRWYGGLVAIGNRPQSTSEARMRLVRYLLADNREAWDQSRCDTSQSDSESIHVVKSSRRRSRTNSRVPEVNVARLPADDSTSPTRAAASGGGFHVAREIRSRHADETAQ
jgi:hypothetical protein